MAQTKKGPARPCRIFLCYRGNTAEPANHFRSVMEHDRENSYGNIWYSSRQYSGRLIRDLPAIMSEAEWVIFFIGKTFTGGFIDENEETNKHCVTAHELIAIETERQKRQREGREELKMLTINIDDAKLDRTCELDLKHLFSNAKILEDDSVGTYTELLPNVYNSSRDDLFDFVDEHIAPICALPQVQAAEVSLAPMPKKESQPELLTEHKQTEFVLRGKEEGGPSSNTRTTADLAEPRTAEMLQAFSRILDNLINEIGLKKLENGNVLFGSYRQTLKGEKRPIEWQILKKLEDCVLLVSRFAIDIKRYNDVFTSITWEKSSLCRWLNVDFFKEAFDQDEQQRIMVMSVSADQNPSWDSCPGKDALNMIFLLSIQEAEEYFSSNESRCCTPSDYAASKYRYSPDEYQKDGQPTSWWWLRTPGGNNEHVATIRVDGTIDFAGRSAFYDVGAVRPAMWVRLYDSTELQ